jgi:chromosome segregation ATPase
MEKIHKLENDLIREKDDIEKFKHEVEKLKDEKSREERKFKYAEEEKNNLQKGITEKDKALGGMLEEKSKKDTEFEALKKKLESTELSLKTKSDHLIESKDQFNKMKEFAKQWEREKNALIEKANQSDLELSEARNKLKQLEKESKDINRENHGLMTDKDRMAREKMEALNEKNITKAGVNALTREIEYLRKQTESEKTNILNLIRDRNMMKNSILKAEEDNMKNKEELINQINEVKKLNEDKKLLTANMDGILKQSGKLEKERDKFSHEASKANANLMQMVEEVKLKKNLISELKKENIEFEGKLKQQQNLYEAVRSDRNLYSKNLIEAQDEVAELKRKFKIASH